MSPAYVATWESTVFLCICIRDMVRRNIDMDCLLGAPLGKNIQIPLGYMVDEGHM